MSSLFDNEQFDILLDQAQYKHNNSLIVSLIEQYPYLLNKTGKNKFTLLHRASYGNNSDLVIELIKRGANIHALCSMKYTPLMDASSTNSIDVVKILLENGSNPNSRNCSGYTAFLLAAFKDYHKVCNLLLLNGANLQMSYGNFTLLNVYGADISLDKDTKAMRIESFENICKELDASVQKIFGM